MGRPTDFTQEIAAAICQRVANGESLRAICLSEEMPGRSTVHEWLAKDSAFADQYAHARDAQADVYADEIVAIADEEAEDSQRQRLRVDARKWVASKLKPKKYGDKVTQEVSGPEGGPVPVKVTVEFVGSAT